MNASRLGILFLVFFTASAASAAFELEPQVLGPTAGVVSDVATAYAGGKYLTVWRQNRMPSVGIWGAFSDADGKPMMPAFPVLPASNAVDLRLFAEGDSYVLVWNEAHRGPRIARVDASGRATAPAVLDLDPRVRADAFVDGRVITVGASGAAVVDPSGAVVRKQIDPVNFWGLQTAFAGKESFFLTTRWPDLRLARYSPAGDLVRSAILERNQCQQTTSGCWWIIDLEELPSGNILLLLQNESQQLATQTLTADGTPSERKPILTPFANVRSAILASAGAQLSVLAVGGAQSEGPYEIALIDIDESGDPTTAPSIVASDIAVYGMAAVAEGPDGVFAAAITGSFPSQITTTLIRDGVPVATHTVSITPTIQTNAQLASNGTSFLATWSDADGTTFSRIHWRLLNASGEPSSAVYGAAGDLIGHSLVSNGLDYAMLVRFGDALVVRRVSSDGTILGDTRIVEAFDEWRGGAAIAATPAGYLIVWSSYDVVRSALVTGTSATVPREIARLSNIDPGTLASYNDPALAWNGTEALVVFRRVDQPRAWMPFLIEAELSLEAVALSSDGERRGELMELGVGRAAASHPLVASSGDEFLVAAFDTRFVIRDGAFETVRAHAETPPNDIIWDGSSYVLSYAYERFDRISRGGVAIAVRTRRGVEGVDVASDSSGRLLLAASESGAAGPLRAHSYTASDFGTPPMRRRSAAP